MLKSRMILLENFSASREQVLFNMIEENLLMCPVQVKFGCTFAQKGKDLCWWEIFLFQR